MPSVIEKKSAVAQSVEGEKNELAIKLLSLQDKSVVHAMRLIYDDLIAITEKTSETQYNKEIDAAVKRVRSGKSVSNEQVINEMKKW